MLSFYKSYDFWGYKMYMPVIFLYRNARDGKVAMLETLRSMSAMSPISKNNRAGKVPLAELCCILQ